MIFKQGFPTMSHTQFFDQRLDFSWKDKTESALGQKI